MSIFNKWNQNHQKKAKELRKVLRELKKNEIIMEPIQKAEFVGPNDCKIGGKPYLPADFEWPKFRSADDGIARPLSFFCQINLAMLNAFDKENVLPKRGMLYFFYECNSLTWGFDPADKGAARVFYFENTDGFVPLDLPGDLAEEYIIPEIAVKFKSQESYPCFEEFENYSDFDCDGDDYDEMLEKLGFDAESNAESHKLLGYADVIQGEMLTECERVSRGLYCGDAESYASTSDDVKAAVAKHAGEWLLLLQLSTISKDNFEWMFGDCGMLYFYIRKDDLATKRFDKIHFCLQCY